MWRQFLYSLTYSAFSFTPQPLPAEPLALPAAMQGGAASAARACDRGDPACDGYFNRYATVYAIANTPELAEDPANADLVVAIRKTDPFRNICLLGDAALQSADHDLPVELRTAFVEWVDAHPVAADQDTATAIRRALQAAFPCE